ncbi:hypothetical protein OsJ_32825 [Oryza sativa Japonica Group]|uniref:Uncharacterized protein n=2 Tax=Oryza sativa subsp. japonica TaxID=39947 RepID=A0A8J8Y5P8_ORYSJ|nr:expressed protein [Oryza sativa Japonica Group]EAZ17303.1 hypothetical protein OsJ_32825 [Oryza sativa Japonica Group]
MTPDDMAATCSMKCPIYQKENKGAVTVTSTFRAFRHAEQPALRTLLAPEKRLLVRSGTEGSFTKFINAPYKSECLELYEMMDEYCREPMDLFGTAPALTLPLLELELSQTVSAPPKLGVELDWTEAYNLFKEQGIKDLVVNVK